jgi:tripartite ATP-independent transporter DctP family solute receptor
MGKVSRRAVLLSAASGLAAAPFVSRSAWAAPIVLRIGHSTPVNHPLHLRLVEASAAIAKETNGAVRLDIFPNNQLGGDNDMMDQARSGALDFCTPPGQVLSSILPTVAVTALGFIFTDADHVWAALDGKVGDLLRGELASKAGLIAMDKVWDYGFKQIMTSTRPVHTVEDLAGLKIRVPPSPVGISLFKTLGASPATIQFNDLYTALQTHLVDGLDNQLTNFLLSQFYEVQKYCAVTNHSWDGPWLCASAITWNNLPADIRKVVADRLNAEGVLQRQDMVTLGKSSQTKLLQHGMVFNTVDVAPFRQKLKTGLYYADWRAKLGDAPFKLLETYVGPIG